MSRTWYDSDGKRLEDTALLTWIKEAVSKAKDNGYQTDIIVGTDSHMAGKQFRFITVVCAYTHSKGGMYYYTPEYEAKTLYKKNHQFRMFAEVQRSIAIADFIVEETGLIPVVHIDASPKHKGEFTSEFSDSLKGYAVAAGYECVIKPDSFVANAVADRHTR